VVAGDEGVAEGEGVAVAGDVGFGVGLEVAVRVAAGDGEAVAAVFEGDGEGEASRPNNWSEFATAINSFAVRSPLMTTRQSPEYASRVGPWLGCSLRSPPANWVVKVRDPIQMRAVDPAKKPSVSFTSRDPWRPAETSSIGFSSVRGWTVTVNVSKPRR